MIRSTIRFTRPWFAAALGLAVVLAACSPKRGVRQDPYAEPDPVDAYEAVSDTLTYDFLAESVPPAEAPAPAEADLPDLSEAVEPVDETPPPAPPAAVEKPQATTPPPQAEGPLFWVQILASRNRESAESFALEADAKLDDRVRILFLDDYYKVLVGGFADRGKAVALRRDLVADGYEGAWIVEK
jgi:hypothetical protein